MKLTNKIFRILLNQPLRTGVVELHNDLNVLPAGASPGQKMWGGHTWRARAYNGDLGAEPPAGPRGRAPGQGVRGDFPPEAENLLAFKCPTKAANLPHSPYFANSLNPRYL